MNEEVAMLVLFLRTVWTSVCGRPGTPVGRLGLVCRDKGCPAVGQRARGRRVVKGGDLVSTLDGPELLSSHLSG